MTRVFSTASLGLGLVAIQSCAPLPPSDMAACPALPIAEAVVRPTGADVRINGVTTSCPQPLRQQDVIVTGMSSSATVRFTDGTTIIIPENTDPIFSWGPPAAPGSKGTVQVVLDEGWSGVVSGYRYSVRYVTRLSSGLYLSRGAVEARPTRTTAYLFEGRLRIERPTPGRDVAPMQLFETGSGVPARVRAITPQERQRVAAVFDGRLISPTFGQAPLPPAPGLKPPPPPPFTPQATVPPPPPGPKFTPKATVQPPPKVSPKAAVPPPPPQPIL